MNRFALSPEQAENLFTMAISYAASRIGQPDQHRAQLFVGWIAGAYADEYGTWLPDFLFQDASAVCEYARQTNSTLKFVANGIVQAIESAGGVPGMADSPS